MNNCVSNYKLLILIVLVSCIAFVGCKKKEPQSPFKNQLPEYDSIVTTISSEEIEESIEDEEIEELEIMSIEVDTSSSIAPTPKQVQIALKNSGYYKGEIDGKIGPMSKEAIINFQRDNGLSVDGKVGPKTWSKLRKHLKP
ncbi:peptidoglycan-binding protein [Candidatus Omnitrophota bacterium]